MCRFFTFRSFTSSLFIVDHLFFSCVFALGVVVVGNREKTIFLYKWRNVQLFSSTAHFIVWHRFMFHCWYTFCRRTCICLHVYGSSAHLGDDSVVEAASELRANRHLAVIGIRLAQFYFKMNSALGRQNSCGEKFNSGFERKRINWFLFNGLK